MKTPVLTLSTKISLLLSFVLSSVAFAADPTSVFVAQGQPNSPWKFSVGNALGWGIAVENQVGKTKRGNVTVEPISKTTTNDAIKVKWRGRNKKAAWYSNITLNGHKIDLSSVEDTSALQLQIRVVEQPTSVAKISMRCNWSNKCDSELALNPVLKQMPKNEWTELTLPLNCFNQDGKFDFKNLTDIFAISTQGKMELDIANAYLVALPAGHTGCK
ncbi:putative glycoside hydrolase [Catenovulum agarivorans]|uniref:putative glycoside hydrolase n=1 Tax=Catenovulum agarivorans TaxID=1172192 RepID=UPI0002E2C4A6|nr:putative glycoside hydrolase [Catenovulum agarivorans]